MGIEDTRSGQNNSELRLDSGPYLARIVNNIDPMKQGSLEVQLLKTVGNQSIGERAANQETYIVKYLSPFYGITDITHNGSDVNDFNETQKSYGFWFVPPDTGTLVLVIFAEGNPGQGFWIGCVQDSFMNHMVPGIAGSKNIQSQVKDSDEKEWKDDFKSISEKYGSDFLPAAEFNRNAIKEGNAKGNPSIDENKKPIHPMADVLLGQGLQNDTVRGVHTSSSRRETPSNVYGISTPGPLDKRNKAKKGKVGRYNNQITKFVSRLGGHTLVMDDGNENKLRKYKPDEGPPEYVDLEAGGTDGLIEYPQDESFRIRTRTGHQILLHNAEDLIYIGNASGTAWIELTSQGKIDIYSTDSVSIHTEADFNFTADRDINLHAERSINMYAGTRISGQSEDNISFNAGVSLLMNAKNNAVLSAAGAIDLDGKNAIDIRTTQLRLTGQSLIDILSSGNVHVTATSNLELKGSKSLLSSRGDTHILSAGTNYITANSTHVKTYGATFIDSGTTDIKSGGVLSIGAGGQISLGSGAHIAMQGTQIHMNGGTAPIAPSTASPALQAVEAVAAVGVNQSPKELVLFPLPGVGSVLSKRAPTAEPWPHHENTNPSGFTTDLTDREKPDMPYTKDGDRLSIRSTKDSETVPVRDGGRGANPGEGFDSGAGANPGSARKNKFPVDKSTSTSDPNTAIPPTTINDAQLSRMPSDWLQDKEFLSKCQELAGKYGCDITDVLGCMHFESAASMSPAIQNKFGYTGLIQMGDSACVTLSKAYKETVTTSMLKAMSRVQYCVWAERYWDYWIKTSKVPQPMNLYKLYLLIGYPAAAKYDPDYAFGPVGSKVWENNPSWRSKGGGPITPRSMSVAPERSKAIVTAMLKKGGAAPLA